MNKMEILPLEFQGTFIVKAPHSQDARGSFYKTVFQPRFQEVGLDWSFPEQFYSVSHKGVLRGLHFQLPPHDHAKLIYCVSGAAVDVLLDMRAKSKTFGKCISIELKGGDGNVIYIPKGLAHGFYSLEDQTTMMYSVGSTYQPTADTGVRWDSISYDWKIQNPIISERDAKLPPFNPSKSPFTEGL